MENYCSYRIWPLGLRGFFLCKKKAKVQEEGEWRCGVHMNAASVKRQAKAEEKRKAHEMKNIEMGRDILFNLRVISDLSILLECTPTEIVEKVKELKYGKGK